jgi:polygalacturonase
VGECDDGVVVRFGYLWRNQFDSFHCPVFTIRKMMRSFGQYWMFLLLFISCSCFVQAQSPVGYDVRTFGAKGDGQTLDTEAINKAIEAAAAKGGGTVYFPAGIYLSFSIRLKSNIALYLDAGATILAADPARHKGKYDLAEPNEWDMYQDFGHSHWQNSLIWGIGLENVSILGSGRIDGTKGLTRRGPGPRAEARPGDSPNSLGGGRPGNRPQTPLDTNRDGFDIDACRNVRISNCSVNTPNDDAIVLKSSYALFRYWIQAALRADDFEARLQAGSCRQLMHNFRQGRRQFALFQIIRT